LLLDSVIVRISAIALDPPNEVVEEVVRDPGDARRCPQQEAGRGVAGLAPAGRSG